MSTSLEEARWHGPHPYYWFFLLLHSHYCALFFLLLVCALALLQGGEKIALAFQLDRSLLRQGVLACALGALLCGILALLRALTTAWTTRYLWDPKTRCLRVTSGLVTRNTALVPANMVLDCGISQDPLEQILGASTVTIELGVRVPSSPQESLQTKTLRIACVVDAETLVADLLSGSKPMVLAS